MSVVFVLEEILVILQMSHVLVVLILKQKTMMIQL